ncbi:hypothetical protein Ocin01_18405, partial [Orchesella cincta]
MLNKPSLLFHKSLINKPSLLQLPLPNPSSVNRLPLPNKLLSQLPPTPPSRTVSPNLPPSRLCPSSTVAYAQQAIAAVPQVHMPTSYRFPSSQLRIHRIRIQWSC